jgi:hypothetical protein
MATVMAVDVDARALTLKHGAIDTWSMPGMTMVFDVAPEIDLTGVQIGTSAHVQIERHGGGHFVVTAVHVMPAMDEPEADAHAGHDMSDHDMADMPSDEPDRGEADEHEGHQP